ncbi:hypothetical protein M231_05706 [Tremella mesenterica]|uniref:Uncharacterized protein n=1 Tax=Tremella mesenterica TaxID=5217 RepID=A0A4Q1BHC4_TREME|nr:hypothetical protein M231_05706 [Tremella mesenterica]
MSDPTPETALTIVSTDGQQTRGVPGMNDPKIKQSIQPQEITPMTSLVPSGKSSTHPSDTLVGVGSDNDELPNEPFASVKDPQIAEGKLGCTCPTAGECLERAADVGCGVSKGVGCFVESVVGSAFMCAKDSVCCVVGVVLCPVDCCCSICCPDFIPDLLD